MNLNECVNKGYLVKLEPDSELAAKELTESDYDMAHSASTLEEEDFKWSIVKSYYAMFHAARALLFKLGYREKKHFAVVVVLDDLNKKGKLEPNFIDDFKAAISAREDADYHYIHSKEAAQYNLKIAKEFTARIKKLIGEM